ncbi:hypothetical protein [Mesorhizobium sp. ORM16]|uniref:hypothetical protein n=1 Tax=Mesorhizobium sp. ORM16 TaxID=3376989 RepID=UPI00385728DF
MLLPNRFLCFFHRGGDDATDQLRKENPAMRLIKNLLALIVLAVGALWSLQGIGAIGGSFMTGQSQWLTIGIIVMLVGLAELVWANRSRG